MNARTIITQLIQTTIIPVLRPAGFTTTGFAFHRRCDLAVQVVNVQLSQGNRGTQGRFSINIGLNFDRVCALEGKPIVDKPKVYTCQYYHRLERVVPEAPAWWEFETAATGLALAAPLHTACEHLLAYFNRVTTIEAFLTIHQTSVGNEWGFQAQLYYLLGRHREAIAALQAMRAFFQERPQWSLDKTLEQLGLTALRSELHAEQS